MGSTNNAAGIYRGNAATYQMAIVFLSTDRSVPVVDGDISPEVLTEGVSGSMLGSAMIGPFSMSSPLVVAG